MTIKPAQSVHGFNREQWLEGIGLAHHKLLYLDFKYWIEMIEAASPAAIELRRVLSQKVATGQLLCPLSPILLLELNKLPKSEKRTNYAMLMDELSRRISLRHWIISFEEEFKCRVEGRSIQREIAFSHFLDAFSKQLQITVPDKWSEANVSRAVSLLSDYLATLSVPDILNMEGVPSAETIVPTLRANLNELTRQALENIDASHRGNIEKVEFAATVRAVMPQITSALLTLNPEVLEKLVASSLEEKSALLDECPTFHAHYKLVAALRSNRSQIKENDLWDIQHVLAAAPYVDCVGSDGGTRHLCVNMLHLNQKFGTTILSETTGLLEWLAAN